MALKKNCEMQENEVQSFEKERDGVGKAHRPPPPTKRGKWPSSGGVRPYVGY